MCVSVGMHAKLGCFNRWQEVACMQILCTLMGSIADAEHQTFNTKHQTSNTKHQAFNTKQQAFNTKHQAINTKQSTRQFLTTHAMYTCCAL